MRRRLTPRQLGLDTPIRQGQTRYSYLVMQFTHEEEITAELNMTECVALIANYTFPNLYLASN